MEETVGEQSGEARHWQSQMAKDDGWAVLAAGSSKMEWVSGKIQKGVVSAAGMARGARGGGERASKEDDDLCFVGS